MVRIRSNDWANRPKNNRILSSFSLPKTPAQVKNELGIRKFKLRPFLDKELLKCLTPERKKGRLYVLTEYAKKSLKIYMPAVTSPRDYALLGWILASPKQRYVVLNTLSTNWERRTSEEIRVKSTNSNPRLSRISTKSILKELIKHGLVETEIGTDRRRYYWITEKGKLLVNNLH